MQLSDRGNNARVENSAKRATTAINNSARLTCFQSDAETWDYGLMKLGLLLPIQDALWKSTKSSAREPYRY